MTATRKDFHRFSRWHFVVLVFVAALLVAVLWPKASHSSATASRVARQSLVPNGETYHGVVQANIATTICHSGFTASIRPPTSYTSALKKWLLKDRNLSGTTASYQLAHAISLELGGAPYSTRNLFMVPIVQAHIDDRKENEWNREVCAGILTLRQGQQAELAWKRANG